MTPADLPKNAGHPMPVEGQPIHLTDAERDDLEEIARSHGLAAGFVQPAKIVLLLADGISTRAVETKLDVSRPTIAKWRRRFTGARRGGFDQPLPGPAGVEVDGAAACSRAGSHAAGRHTGPADASPPTSA